MTRPPGTFEQSLRRAARRPVVAYRRRRHASDDPYARQLLEAVDHRRSMLTFMEAMRDDPDLLLRADLDRTSTVVDGGAFVGEWAAEMASRYGSRVVAFEPGPMFVAEMRRRLGPDVPVEIVPVGLGDRDRRAAFAVEGPGSRVVDAGDDPATEVELRDVAAVLPELDIDHIDLLKLNIEGGEYDVLERMAATGWLERVDDLLVQFHDVVPGAPRRRRAIRRALRRTHDLAWDHPWVWERWIRRT